MRLLSGVFLALAVGGCAYKAETVATPANNVVTSYSAKVPGRWLVSVNAEQLTANVRSSDFGCAAHSFPLDFRNGLPASVRATLPNVLERVEDVETPVSADRLKASGAKGMINIRGENLQARLRMVPGFLTASIATEVELSASITVDGPSGRMFGKTIDGRGKADASAGLACAGGAESLKMAAEQAQKDLLRRIAEEIGNSERIRRGS